MSQQGKAGLSAPRFAIGSGEPDVVGPEGAVNSTATVAVSSSRELPVEVSVRSPFLIFSISSSLTALLSFALGVGQVAAACRGNWSSLTRPSGPVVAMPGVSL